jgi:hypothetical protein
MASSGMPELAQNTSRSKVSSEQLGAPTIHSRLNDWCPCLNSGKYDTERVHICGEVECQSSSNTPFFRCERLGRGPGHRLKVHWVNERSLYCCFVRSPTYILNHPPPPSSAVIIHLRSICSCPRSEDTSYVANSRIYSVYSKSVHDSKYKNWKRVQHLNRYD